MQQQMYFQQQAQYLQGNGYYPLQVCDGWIDGWMMNRCMDGWIDGWMDGRMDGCMDG
jgi:hypothetical protein